MSRIGFPYILEMHKHIKKKRDEGISEHAIWKTWPNKWKDGDKPSSSSIKRRAQRIDSLGIEGALRIGGEQRERTDWLEEEVNNVILGYDLCKGDVAKAVRLIMCDKEFEKYFNIPFRTYVDLESRICILRHQGILEQDDNSTNQGRVAKDYTYVWIERWESIGFTIVAVLDKGVWIRFVRSDPGIIKNYTKIKVRCPVGHVTETWGYFLRVDRNTTSCDTCRHLNSAFSRHPDPLAPGIFYWGPLLDSPLNDLKLGNTLERIGVKERSKKYGKFKWKEAHKPIGEVEDFEEEMKIKYDTYCTNNPMLEGNGSTETFKLIIIPDLEKDIKEWIK